MYSLAAFMIGADVEMHPNEATAVHMAQISVDPEPPHS